MLLIITSTVNELLRNVNIDDLTFNTENKKFLLILFAILRCDTHFKSDLRRNG